MNDTISNYAREQIKQQLFELPERYQLFFKRLYSHEDQKKPLNEIIDNIPEEKLNWVLTQVENTRIKEIEKIQRIV